MFGWYATRADLCVCPYGTLGDCVRTTIMSRSKSKLKRQSYRMENPPPLSGEPSLPRHSEWCILHLAVHKPSRHCHSERSEESGMVGAVPTLTSQILNAVKNDNACFGGFLHTFTCKMLH